MTCPLLHFLWVLWGSRVVGPWDTQRRCPDTGTEERTGGPPASGDPSAGAGSRGLGKPQSDPPGRRGPWQGELGWPGLSKRGAAAHSGTFLHGPGRGGGPTEQQRQHRMESRETTRFSRQCSIYSTLKLSPKAEPPAGLPVVSTVSSRWETNGFAPASTHRGLLRTLCAPPSAAMAINKARSSVSMTVPAETLPVAPPPTSQSSDPRGMAQHGRGPGLWVTASRRLWLLSCCRLSAAPLFPPFPSLMSLRRQAASWAQPARCTLAEAPPTHLECH